MSLLYQSKPVVMYIKHIDNRLLFLVRVLNAMLDDMERDEPRYTNDTKCLYDDGVHEQYMWVFVTSWYRWVDFLLLRSCHAVWIQSELR